MTNLPSLSELVTLARHAGDAILEVYHSNDFNVEIKGDGSPLTRADKAAHEIIDAGLKALTPDIPVLSEENAEEVGDARLAWSRYWLVDPLDGTKEFIKRNDDFTVNIALIDNQKPIIGVVYAPVLDTCYFASAGNGAFKQLGEQPPQAIRCTPLSREKITVVASRSHGSEALHAFLAELENQYATVETRSMGSSLKLCLVAEGAADLYPRLAPTSEWDTAAAHCVVEAAGGGVLKYENGKAEAPLAYSKSSLLNPWFLVVSEPDNPAAGTTITAPSQ